VAGGRGLLEVGLSVRGGELVVGRAVVCGDGDGGL